MQAYELWRRIWGLHIEVDGFLHLEAHKNGYYYFKYEFWAACARKYGFICLIAFKWLLCFCIDCCSVVPLWLLWLELQILGFLMCIYELCYALNMSRCVNWFVEVDLNTNLDLTVHLDFHVEKFIAVVAPSSYNFPCIN